jgi:hypothetical protein
MKRSIVVFIILSSSPAFAGTPSPDFVAKDIAARGAEAAVAKLTKSGDYDRVLDRIDQGDARWIALAPKIAPGVDAGNAEALVISLAFALPKNPRAVLAIVGGKDGFPVDDVCGAPFIEGTVKSVPTYIKKAEAAVLRVSDPALAETKDACLAQLRNAVVP